MSSFAVADAALSGVLSAAGSFLSSVPSPARLVVAVSGGSDSTGLLLALRAALATGRYPGLSILACTVDHGLRPESADEARAVAALCARHGIEHHIRRWEGPKPATGLSAASREARYDLLAGIARETKAVAILTGHTADDQRETITMRKARGAPESAGTSGMAAEVLFDRSVWIMRPFLALARDDIRTFLSQSGEGWIDDPSNRNMAYERARVRVGLAGDNVSPEEATDASVDRKALSEAAADFAREHLRVYSAVDGDSPGRLVPALVARTDLEGIGRALRDRGGWRAVTSLAAAMGGRVFPAGPVDRSPLRAFLESGILSRVTFGRVVYDRRKDGLYIYRECRGILPLTVQPGERRLWDGRYWVVNASRSPLLVEAAGSHRMPYGVVADGSVPDAVAKRAGRAAPSLKTSGGEPPGAAVSVEAHLAPYDRFLPAFDLELANALAPTFGREPFPSPFGG
ncbi:tRNA lysidine(34) synthetase TilS [Sinorhizobium sp. BG8]|uniref:tRNA lysidine(34) synthetase TilS n=1 Tax=Sinorhizobium sp. BG8 TaxID=2613773 RepID=UPI00193CE985|nr:tRNA lysidine(34) synthetase TilS [Sinorhizobium sp. BG8]QRM56583.1 tRNA lysidine(34) synthetase TilS [Sinorhizobium sp. BG8]